MTIYRMFLQEPYFGLVVSGKKTIELRLCDEKRALIGVGDTIEFISRQEPSKTIRVGVKLLHRALTFVELASKIDVSAAGFLDTSQMETVMEQFYPSTLQREKGVLGIEIERITNNEFLM